MDKLVWRALATTALAGGLWAAGTGIASAVETDATVSVGSQDLVTASVSVPIDVAGIETDVVADVGLLGDGGLVSADADVNAAVGGLPDATVDVAAHVGGPGGTPDGAEAEVAADAVVGLGDGTTGGAPVADAAVVVDAVVGFGGIAGAAPEAAGSDVVVDADVVAEVGQLAGADVDVCLDVALLGTGSGSCAPALAPGTGDGAAAAAPLTTLDVDATVVATVDTAVDAIMRGASLVEVGALLDTDAVVNASDALAVDADVCVAAAVGGALPSGCDSGAAGSAVTGDALAPAVGAVVDAGAGVKAGDALAAEVEACLAVALGGSSSGCGDAGAAGGAEGGGGGTEGSGGVDAGAAGGARAALEVGGLYGEVGPGDGMSVGAAGAEAPTADKAVRLVPLTADAAASPQTGAGGGLLPETGAGGGQLLLPAFGLLAAGLLLVTRRRPVMVR